MFTSLLLKVLPRQYMSTYAVYTLKSQHCHLHFAQTAQHPHSISPLRRFYLNVTMAASVTITDYQARVYDLLKQIPSGKVSTYAALSQALGSSPRAVGGALRRNPYAPEVPCHRVISADGVSISQRCSHCGKTSSFDM